ncbi:hypothetical protein [Streptococcus suis]|uniref:hypothetical protein n=1 Tax=Streptococcus suis TaxID=1307 RepID=UPI00209BFE68|nr:hypothetical protein [Streptococcus suis]MCO8233511.1 hypothetical protein [Streptococcus suis]HEM3542506.1 hypothetical protein [Streptococcus suis]
MLFYIKNEVLENAHNYKENLEYLLESFYKGYHIVDFESLSVVKKNLIPTFEGDDKILKAIRFYEIKRQDIVALRQNHVTQYTEVGVESFEIVKNDDKEIIKMPISYFDGDLLSSWILSENPQDCDFYISMFYNAKYFKYIQISDSVKLSFEIDNGGGCGTAIMLERRIDEKKVVLCIVDSDRKEPREDVKGTAGQVNSAMEDLQTTPKIADAYILNVREKENLIPPQLYKQFSKFSNFETIRHLSGFHGTEKEVLLGYVKISNNEAAKFRKHNAHIFAELSLTNTMRGIGKSGLSEFALNKLYTEELRDKMKIDTKGRSIDNRDLINLFQNIPNYLDEDYRQIVYKIFSFACSFGRIRI